MLVKWNPITDLDNTMKQFFPKPWLTTPFLTDQEVSEKGWSPAVDIYEEKDAWHITAHLPGMDLKDLSVDIKEAILTLRGTRTFEHKENEKDFTVREIQYGEFFRSFVLPKDVQTDSISAEYKNGVLTLRLPKGEESKPRQISIEAA